METLLPGCTLSHKTPLAGGPGLFRMSFLVRMFSLPWISSFVGLLSLCCLINPAIPPSFAQSKQNAEDYFKRAVVEMSKQPTQDRALRYFEMAIKLSPGTAKYYGYQAELLNVLEEDEASLIAANKATAIDPKCEIAWFARGKALGRLKRPEEGAKSISVAIGLAPKDPLTYIARARLYVVLNKWEDAESDVEKAILLAPDCGTPYSVRIKVSEHLKKWSKVISDCTTLLKIEPAHHGYMYRSRAGAYLALHDYAKAISDLKEAIKIWPDDIKIHQELEAVYKTLGDTKGLAEEGAKIKSLNRDF
jgi:tetratricopeptide (TPR) repeat protein